ncbi:MAG TPA: dTDP-4-dehydrorhamnose 3,5-epimerase [Allocoleopsis sp.]
MKFIEKEIKGVFEIVFDPKEDERGFFMRAYDKKIFENHGIKFDFVQENHSLSKHKGTIRGLHFQYPPDCECKLMRTITGEIFLAIVDIRKDSPTFGRWTSIVLSEHKKNMAIIPRGCTNGICTLTDNCHLIYKVDSYYNPNNEAVISWDDPDLNINWPIKNPSVISERDKTGMSFQEFKKKHGGLKP